MSKGFFMKIVIIEDDTRTADVIGEILHSQWPAAEIHHNTLGIPGVARVMNNQPDVVILDIGLPDISGLEVIKRIRCFSRVPIITMSAICDEEAVAKALDYGANRFISKPFRIYELLMGVEEIIPIQPQVSVC
jgi:DNA-binding response OmpR family regulator